MSAPPDPGPGKRLVLLWLALAAFFALFVGTVGGVLGWLSGQSVATAVMTGGITFAGTLTLAVLIITLLSR